MAEFDPYLKWLGIRSQGRAPNHYRLLGLDLFEADSGMISNAAARQIAQVKTFQQGPEGDYAEDLLNRLANAQRTLSNPESKLAYDQKLKVKIKAIRAARAKATGPANGSGSGGDIHTGAMGRQLPQQPSSSVAAPGRAVRQAVRQPPAAFAADRPVVPSATGNVGASAIDQRPERKKRSPIVSLILALLMWASSAVAAVVCGYLIINSSWFPGGQADPEVAELDPARGALDLSVADGKSQSLPDIDDILDTRTLSNKGNVKAKSTGESMLRRNGSVGGGAFSGNRKPKLKQPNKNVKKRSAKKPPNESLAGGDVASSFGIPDSKEPAETPPPAKAEPIVRSAIPEREIVASLTQSLKDLYKSGYGKDALPAAKKKLAESLLKDGLLAREPAMQFAMISQSIDVASSVGDGATAVEALEALDRHFEIDFWGRADEVVDEVKRRVKAMPQYESAVAGVDRLIDRSLSESRFDEAFVVTSVGLVLARKFKDLKRFQRFESMAKDLKNVRTIAKKAEAAEKKLATDPNDPSANLDQGNYLYLVKDDLRGALAHWAKSSSEEHQLVAELEVAASRSDGAQLLELAIAWRTLGARLKTASDVKYSFRAKELCEKSAPLLDGLNKLKAENMALELSGALKGKEAIDVASLASTEMESTGSPFLDAVYQHDWSIDFYSDAIPDLRKATFLPSGMAAMVTTRGVTYQVAFEVDEDGVYWTQATTSGNPIRVGIRPYLTGFSRLRCYSQSRATSSAVSAGYATQLP